MSIKNEEQDKQCIPKRVPYIVENRLDKKLILLDDFAANISSRNNG